MSSGAQNPTVTISKPTNTNPANVQRTGNPLSCDLCEAEGAYSNDNGYLIQGVYLKIFKRKIVAPTQEDIDDTILLGTTAANVGGNAWSHSPLPDSGCSGENTLIAVGEFYNPQLGLPDHDVAAHWYTATAVDACGGGSGSGSGSGDGAMSTATSAGAAIGGVSPGGSCGGETMATAANTHVDVVPISVEDDWMTYHLSVTNGSDGNRLLLPNGSLLQASAIAVAAPKVDWRFSHELFGNIHRPIGDLSDPTRVRFVGRYAAPNRAFRFFHQPNYALVVHQRVSRTSNRAIFSQDIAQPDVITLDSNQPVYAQVNDKRFQFADNIGSIELTVKILQL